MLPPPELLAELLAPGRAPLERLRVEEERLLEGVRAPGRPGGVPFEPQRLQPTGLAEGVEPGELRPTHRPQLPGLCLKVHLVARERFPRVLQSDTLSCEPQRRPLPARAS